VRLAHLLTTILPAMSLAEALETTGSHRLARRTNGHTALGTLPSPREHVMLRNPSEHASRHHTCAAVVDPTALVPPHTPAHALAGHGVHGRQP
jgi:hypothetical protein